MMEVERDTVYIALPRIQERWSYLLVKRLFDFFFALICLIVLEERKTVRNIQVSDNEY